MEIYIIPLLPVTVRHKTMGDNLLYIPNDDIQNYPSVDSNYWLLNVS